MSFKSRLHCQTLGCKMGYTIKNMLKRLNEQFEKHDVDLTIQQFFVLNMLDREAGLILQDIAERYGKDKSAVFRHVNALEKKHFITRVTCADDKRKKILILTKPGMETLEKARLLETDVDRSLTGHINIKELAVFEKVLFEIFKKAQPAHNS